MVTKQSELEQIGGWKRERNHWCGFAGNIFDQSLIDASAMLSMITYPLQTLFYLLSY